MPAKKEKNHYKKLLKISEERYRIVADFTYDWEYWISPAGRMLYVSPSCERITGYKPHEFINNPRLFEKIIHPEDRKKVMNYLHQMHEKKSVAVIDFRIIRSDGGIRWIGHISQPVYDDEGNPFGRRASNRDVTRNKMIENNLKESQARMHEQNIELERKNLALKELFEQVEAERKRIKKNISVNIDKLVMPLVARIKSMAGDEVQKKYADILEKTLQDIHSSFGESITRTNMKLTMKEVEICNLIKNGLSSKEISEAMRLSIRTVETHRKNIRKKLGLINSSINLSNYLHNFKGAKNA